ncbi:uncharacterized protein LOC117640948 isoform X5 [Thrips palmi]|uniref:Uncharacterized protein LOC117640948 isoform X5 n=1 Tax=Thrips palmi TaxID=161013 RepID=A0A6P8YC59_THRPL|nr:uncharacterized protein LOC117640948 isoform X5 [Thrips palmi]XP_034233887.1 uncharacterized protein LOC117640948 isoform X5 [Thrips palmi]XP_034233888.1 uncharacterized protein LOC117640948 isoform X5 [Thrips palmi]XP_034233889.1 uncharacterized protein LOC117640948 isoform X5 [Thrips palmi]XP_034233890.1 uncharacterized protein LOC117640948 isoform X5 [Thrips palmi]XP_034233891.1 uncharacterized protein LOC117640948 isoform X5 [Thrips palmi]
MERMEQTEQTEPAGRQLGGNRSSAARDVTKVQAEHAGSVLADRSSAELAARSLRP